MARAITRSSGEKDRVGTSARAGRAGRKRFWWVILVLIGTLLIFFSPSVFNPNKVLFANDGPLGAAMAKAIQPPESMKGIWTDLNWVGFPGGTYVPNVTCFVFWILRPVLFAKLYGPICLLLLGLAGWAFFRELRWQPEVCLICALATMLNMNTFSNVCWGLGTRALCLAAILAGLACFEASKRRPWPWVYLVLGGLSVGMSVMEGADNGVIYSLYVAAYVVWSSWQEGGRTVGALGKGIARIAIITLFALLIAAQSIG